MNRSPRRWLARLAAASAITVVATLTTSAPAHAGITHVLVLETQLTLNPGTTGSATVTCPDTRKATGGGALGFTPSVRMLSSRPNGRHAWTITARNDNTVVETVNVRALCAQGIPNADYLLAEGAVPIDPGQSAQAVAVCPTGWQSLGGGFVQTVGTVIPNASDVSGTSAWRARAFNPGTTRATLTAMATCARNLPTRPTPPSSTTIVAPGSQAFPTLACGANQVLTGGGFVKTPENDANVVTASLPTDGNPDFWKWNYKNASGSVTYGFTSRIICFPLG